MRSFFIAPTLAIVATLAAPRTAQAHFVWATLQPDGQVRFALLENPAEAPNPQFGKYVEALQTPLPLGALTGGARYANRPAGTKRVAAQATVGVKNREGMDYLLLYHPSAAASLEAAKEKGEGSVELRARREGDTLIVQVWHDGWLVPGVEVTAHWPGSELAPAAPTDLKGEARFAWPGKLSSGFVGVRAKVTEEVAGEDEGKKFTQKHHWATLTFPSGVQESLTRRLSSAFRKNHEIVAGSAFNVTLFQGQLTRPQAEIHLQQRALIHSEVHRILNAADPALGLPYGAPQKALLPLLQSDLVAMGSGWPTEAQARPLTKAFLEEIRASEKQGPYFALGVFHVYYGGTTNGGRAIGQKLTQTVGFSPTYYSQSGGYLDYLREVDKIADPAAQAELLHGGEAAYRYILASMNEKVFQHE
ncbi:hypothetical protein [Armatimonas sp.]|uniref:hypothetical protein n=1 Tax=Armatimonas sp. TaxID=1872638 RepID=UPI00286C779D|nr:hypothetical protein [Armatimonas sp.]